MFYLLFFILTGLLWFGKLIFYAGIGLAAAILFTYDKYAAIKGKYRIPERHLLFAALLGGAFGALFTILLFRHKTSKPGIVIPVILFTGLHLFLIMISPFLNFPKGFF